MSLATLCPAISADSTQILHLRVILLHACIASDDLFGAEMHFCYTTL
jgi:hypothetical protein